MAALDRDAEIVILLDDFNTWQETAYRLTNPANAAHLRQSVAEAQLWKLVERELIEP